MCFFWFKRYSQNSKRCRCNFCYESVQKYGIYFSVTLLQCYYPHSEEIVQFTFFKNEERLNDLTSDLGYNLEQVYQIFLKSWPLFQYHLFQEKKDNFSTPHILDHENAGLNGGVVAVHQGEQEAKGYISQGESSESDK